MTNSTSSLPAFIWSVADLLRGDFKQSKYGRVILPFTLLRRLECMMSDTKPQVLAQAGKVGEMPLEAQEKLLLHASGMGFYNTSPMDLTKLGETQVLDNLDSYVQTFSTDSRAIFGHFVFTDFLDKLDECNLLYQVVRRFVEIDPSPETI